MAAATVVVVVVVLMAWGSGPALGGKKASKHGDGGLGLHPVQVGV